MYRSVSTHMSRLLPHCRNVCIPHRKLHVHLQCRRSWSLFQPITARHQSSLSKPKHPPSQEREVGNREATGLKEKGNSNELHGLLNHIVKGKPRKSFQNDKESTSNKSVDTAAADQCLAQYVPTDPLDVNHILVVIRSLPEYGNYSYISRHPKFVELVNHLNQNFTKVHRDDLADCLHRFLKVSQPSEQISEIVSKLKDYLQPSLHEMGFNKLYLLLKGNDNRESLESDSNFDQTIQDVCMRRYAEIETAAQITFFMHLANAEEIKCLQMKCLDMVQLMSTNQLFSVLKAMHATNTRYLPLIRAILYHLGRQDLETFQSQKFVGLGEIMAYLKVHDENMLSKWSDIILSRQLTGLFHGQKISLAVSLGKLRWQNVDILTKWGDSLLNVDQRPNHKLIEASIAMYARLHFLPDKVRSSLAGLLRQSSFIDKLTFVSKPRSFVEFMRNLAVLDALPDSGLQPDDVLPLPFTEMVTRLKDQVPAFIFPSICMKLANISSALSVSFPQFVNLMPLDFLERNGIELIQPKKSVLHTQIVKALATKLSNSQLNVNVQSSMGHMIDVELLVDENGQVLAHTGNPAGSGTKRLAIRTVGYNEYLFSPSGRAGTIGPVALMERQLTRAGYTVALIPYYDVQDLDTTRTLLYLGEELKLNLPAEAP